MATAEKTAKKTLANGQGKGGQRLAAAFDAVSRMPALEETVERVVKAASQESSSVTEITELVESDTAMAIAVMKSANNGGGPRGRVSNVPDAVEALTPAGIRAVATSLATYDLLAALRILGEPAGAVSPSCGRDEACGREPRGARRRSRSRRAGGGGAAARRRAARPDQALPGLRGHPRRPDDDPGGSRPDRAPGVRDGPHDRRRRPRPALGPTDRDRRRDRKASLRMRRRTRGRGPAQRPRRPSRGG